MENTSQKISVDVFKGQSTIELPAFGGQTASFLSVFALREAEKRLIEAKNVNPSTYGDLEACYAEAYQEIKRNISTVMYLIMKTEQELEKRKAIALMDKYPLYLENKPKAANTAEMRKAFISLDPEVQEAVDRLDSLKALEFFLDSRAKVMENVSRVIKKKIDLIIRSGLSDPKLYMR